MSTALRRPAAIFFDWDGTLVDTLPGLLVAHNHVRGLHGLTLWSHEEFMRNIKYSSRELYPSIYHERADEALKTLYDFVLTHHLEHLELLMDADTLIHAIHTRGIPMGLVSNKRQQVIEREVDHLGWRDLFYCILGSGAAKRDKPAGDAILLALERATAPLPAQDVWFVGDTVSDLAAAREAGCPCILLTNGEDKTELIETYRPALVLRDCTELCAVFERLFAAAS